jgi:hypothetical protein
LEYLSGIWDIVQPFCTFCVHLVQYIPVLVSCTKENLATLEQRIEKIGLEKECMYAGAELEKKPFLLQWQKKE